MKQSILITGGCGFIGANLVPRLCAQGYRVRVIDNFSTGSRASIPGVDVEVIEGDIRDDGVLRKALRTVDVVVHLAAFGSVVMSVQDPMENFHVNAEGTLKLLKHSVRHNIGTVIFASTGGALIGNAPPPVDERSVPRPISPYGASKLCGEAYCSAMAGAFGLRTVSLRFANVYGPNSWHKKGAVTAFFKAIMDDQPIIIYGDGTASRDLLYVADLCAGISRAISVELPPGEVLHLASGVETSISSLAGMIARIAGKPNHPVIYRPARAGEVGRNFAMYSKAATLLGFSPKVDIKTGLTETWRWFRDEANNR